MSFLELLSEHRRGHRNFAELRIQPARLQNAQLYRSNFRKCNFRNAMLGGADLHGCDLSNADLAHACLLSSNLVSCVLHRACLKYADLSRAHLYGADLSNANLANSNMSDATLLGANLRGANLRSADLRGANLRRANLARAQLQGADLRGARFVEANLTSANLENTKLAGTIFDGANASNAHFCATVLSDASFSGTKLTSANLNDADLSGMDLRTMELTEVNMRRSNLRNSKFRNAKLLRANLSDAVLSRAVLDDADLSGALLRGTDLREASLQRVNFTAADMRDALLNGANIQCADLTDCALSHDINLFNVAWQELRLSGKTYERQHAEEGRQLLPVGHVPALRIFFETGEILTGQELAAAQTLARTFGSLADVQFVFEMLVDRHRLSISSGGTGSPAAHLSLRLLKAIQDNETSNIMRQFERHEELLKRRLDKAELERQRLLRLGVASRLATTRNGATRPSKSMPCDERPPAGLEAIQQQLDCIASELDTLTSALTLFRKFDTAGMDFVNADAREAYKSTAAELDVDVEELLTFEGNAARYVKTAVSTPEIMALAFGALFELVQMPGALEVGATVATAVGGLREVVQRRLADRKAAKLETEGE